MNWGETGQGMCEKKKRQRSAFFRSMIIFKKIHLLFSQWSENGIGCIRKKGQITPWDTEFYLRSQRGKYIESSTDSLGFPLISIRNIILHRKHIRWRNKTDWLGYNKSFTQVECEWVQLTVSFGPGIICSGCVPHSFTVDIEYQQRKF